MTDLSHVSVQHLRAVASALRRSLPDPRAQADLNRLVPLIEAYDRQFLDLTGIDPHTAALIAPTVHHMAHPGHAAPTPPSPGMYDEHGRTCTACYQYKPRFEYHAYKRSPDGLHATCKSCRNAYQNNRNKRHREANRKPYADADGRTCLTCTKYRPHSDYQPGRKTCDICQPLPDGGDLPRPGEHDDHGRTCLSCHRYMGRISYRQNSRTGDGLQLNCNDCVLDDHTSERDRRAERLAQLPGQVCEYCTLTKPFSLFPPDPDGRPGPRPVCLDCLPDPATHPVLGGRRCKQCHTYRNTSDFYRDSRNKDGYQGTCKPCRAVMIRGYRSGRKAQPAPTPAPVLPPVPTPAPASVADEPDRRIDGKGRTCISCGLYKRWSAYGRRKSDATGYSGKCKGCTTQYRLDRAAKAAGITIPTGDSA